jgi:hypothetical protein
VLSTLRISAFLFFLSCLVPAQAAPLLIAQRMRGDPVTCQRNRHQPMSALIRHLMAKGQLHYAVPVGAYAVGWCPDSPVWWTVRGDALAKAGKPDDAGKMYRRALEFDPGYSPAKQGLTSQSP